MFEINARDMTDFAGLDSYGQNKLFFERIQFDYTPKMHRVCMNKLQKKGLAAQSIVTFLPTLEELPVGDDFQEFRKYTDALYVATGQTFTPSEAVAILNIHDPENWGMKAQAEIYKMHNGKRKPQL